MGKTLVIAEKYSVAKEIGHVIGCTKRVSPGKDARFGYFEGNGYLVSWCLGHLVTTCYPEEYKEEYKLWNVEDLPIIPDVWKYSTKGHGIAQYQVLKKLLNSADVQQVVCATDADREGELIFRLVYNESKSKKPVKRLWIRSMEESAIKEGMRKLKPGSDYDSLYHAASARQKADWVVGLNATRYYSVRFSSPGNVLSVGRVQTPTVNLIVQRQLEIDHFKPKPYYLLAADTGAFWAFLKESDKAKADDIIAQCNGKTGVVTSVTQEEKKDGAPALYDLTRLQQDADQMFGFSAIETLDIAQSLYEKKLLTYPRTDSQYLSSDMKDTATEVVNGLLGGKIPKVKDVLAAFGGKKPNIAKVIDDKKVSGHHAIVPTLTSLREGVEGLNDREIRIYYMVAFRLLAAVCIPHEYLATKVALDVNGVVFHASGKQVRVNGWRTVWALLRAMFASPNKDGDKKEFDETKSQALPPLKEGDEFPNTKVAGKEKFTKPPAPYTEATLLADMRNIQKKIEDKDLRAVMAAVDDNGNRKMLGTPATQGAIIEKIIQTGYIEKRGRQLFPAEKAFALIRILPEELKSPNLTAEWEKQLEEIKDGRFSEDVFLDNINEFIRNVITTAQKEFARKKGEEKGFFVSPNSLGPCPLCGSDVVRNKTGNLGCSAWKNGCKFGIYATIAKKRLSDNQVKTLLTKKRTRVIYGFVSKSGKKFDARLVLGADGEISFDFER